MTAFRRRGAACSWAQRRMLDGMVGYCRTTGCLRRYILDYLGKIFATKRARRPLCLPVVRKLFNCLGDFDAIDVTDTAKQCVLCVREVQGAFGKSMIADIVRGSRSQRVIEGELDSAEL